MQEQILTALSNLEQREAIKILYAVESGSRAWGFASTNSDWDVRFIYVHQKDWYLSIDDKKDSIEVMLPDDLDLSGWELRKALNLFRKSNPPFMEWLNSPIVYLEEPFAVNQLRKAAVDYFNPKSCLYHYLSMATSNFKEYLTRDLVKTKKYFYVLRPILACMWIEQTNTMAPTEFHKLFEAAELGENLKVEIQKLLARKMSGTELGEEPRIEPLNNFLGEKIEYYTEYLKHFKGQKQVDTERLNEIFRSTLIEFEGKI
ncbi:MAG: nucleotidyltransferase domain-containing protein [Lewinellaceae bacterium]|nr:nucleotidyltransferase domain-containing protein [Lewinellaceae bacterium]MCB9330496.1 nucleotidyltransferase domain-containing protein [Lewinellaceae bacterium]